MNYVLIFLAGGAAFLLVFSVGLVVGAYFATKPPDQKEPEFSHMEGGKRVCKRA